MVEYVRTTNNKPVEAYQVSNKPFPESWDIWEDLEVITFTAHRRSVLLKTWWGVLRIPHGDWIVNDNNSGPAPYKRDEFERLFDEV